ncbi:MAG TPA: 4-hydroxy-3-methylbut-2-enyl diphosphate reductase [Acidobacteria bacterium]|nr:4-hydroxy-3-methylbut-2-enyl diphosphate reductase [Acidobacteriota bacterium]
MTTGPASTDGSDGVPAQVFRKGLALGREVAGALSADYHSNLIDRIRTENYQWDAGRVRIVLAREFGFCYGVDRAVDYAYQTRKRFPDKTIYLTGEIIHNPQVNDRLRAAGIRFLSEAGTAVNALGPDDVVILPAFGVTIATLAQLQNQECTLVDTTCGSVLNVWKNVLHYARDGFTAVIHGKLQHEETQATASQVLKYPKGRSLVVLNREEAAAVCEFIRHGGDESTFMARFGAATSPGFSPTRDLARVGLANQTTMLMSESLAIGELVRHAMVDRYGENLKNHYRAFDTICSATQDRQDAVSDLLGRANLSLMIVIGGYNSSNTRNLARLAERKVPTFHIADASCLVSHHEIRHRPVDGGAAPTSGTHADETLVTGWMPDGSVTVGLTAGASTPDSVLEQVIERLRCFSTDDG